MTPQEAIQTALKNSSALAAIVGARVYAITAPIGTELPFVVWQIIGGQFGSTHNEAAGDGIVSVQVSCYATTFLSAVAMRAAVIAALDNATLGNGSTGQLEDIRDSKEDAINAYRADADFSI